MVLTRLPRPMRIFDQFDERFKNEQSFMIVQLDCSNDFEHFDLEYKLSKDI